MQVPREIEVSLNRQGPPERIQMDTLKELGYDRVDAVRGICLVLSSVAHDFCSSTDISCSMPDQKAIR